MSEPLMYEAGGFSAFRDKWKGVGHSKLPVGGGGEEGGGPEDCWGIKWFLLGT